MSSQRRVLVTGASGFIGRWTVPALAGRNYEVHAVVSRARAGGAVPEQLDRATVHAIDLLEPTQVETLLESVRPTHLLHLAWNVTPGRYWNSEDNFRWVAASLHLFSTFCRLGGARMTAAGTCAEYDWARVQVCKENESALATDADAVPSPYATCKVGLQKMIAALARERGVSNAWGRVFFQYGPHEHPDRLVSSTILDLLAGREAPCTHGQQVRNFLHVADVAEALVALLDSGVEGPVNIGSDERRTIADVVRFIAASLDRPDLLRLGARPAPANEPPVLVPDVGRLYGEVGWRPAFTLESGLLETIAWWRSNPSIWPQR